MTNGVFLTVEGIEGVGKTTAIKYIQDFLIAHKQEFVLTREPGGTPIAEDIRKILLTPHAHEVITTETELLLMFACRAQHMAHVIMPALQTGKWVVSDRFIDASFAYQGGGRGVPLERIQLLEKWILHGIKPNKTILLDAPPDIGLARAKNRSDHDRIEQEKLDFFERVRESYLSRMKQEPERFVMVDATQSLADVQEQLKTILNELLHG